jgi:hypothetical protein
MAPAPMLKPLLLGAMVLGLTGLGCAHRRPDPQRAAAAAAASALGDDFRATKRDGVPLYRSGPQQVTVPDELLPKDTVARVVRTEFGYSLIQTESGLLGWVASDDLGTPAAPPAIAVTSDTVPIPPSSVSGIDAINARASAQDVPTSATGPASAGPKTGGDAPKVGGDSAIVARYHIDDPAAGVTKPAASPTPKP